MSSCRVTTASRHAPSCSTWRLATSACQACAVEFPTARSRSKRGPQLERYGAARKAPRRSILRESAVRIRHAPPAISEFRISTQTRGVPGPGGESDTLQVRSDPLPAKQVVGENCGRSDLGRAPRVRRTAFGTAAVGPARPACALIRGNDTIATWPHAYLKYVGSNWELRGPLCPPEAPSALLLCACWWRQP